MTGRERSVLETVREEVSEIRRDLKELAAFMATYTERSKGCERRFGDLERTSKWTRGKVLLILGFGGGIGFAFGLMVKLL